MILDRLTKIAHFLPVRMTCTAAQYIRLYLDRIVLVHGMPIPIMSVGSTRFTSMFGVLFQEVLGTQLRFSIAFIPRLGVSQREPFKFLGTCFEHAC